MSVPRRSVPLYGPEGKVDRHHDQYRRRHERAADLLSALSKQRYFLRFTARDLTDEQAAQRTTASALCVGGAIKHVTQTERQWTQFIVNGPSAMVSDESAIGAYMDGFRMLEGETLAGLLADYDQVAQRTDDLIRSLPNLDASHPLPEAPWFEKGASWSARRVLLHVIAETASTRARRHHPGDPWTAPHPACR